ncbi:MAG: hypothetical protein Kow0069_25610 [Promethearchaeota archaeon]
MGIFKRLAKIGMSVISRQFPAKKRASVLLAAATAMATIFLVPLAGPGGGGGRAGVRAPGGLEGASPLAWASVPSFANDKFSPYTTPGQGDVALYSFSVDEDRNYTLAISAYYSAVEGLTGSVDSAEPGAYFLDNGTWLVAVDVGEVVGAQFVTSLKLGIGTNASNFQWTTLGQINETDAIAVAATGSSIRVVYVELKGVGPADFLGLKYYASDDWGASWTSGTVADFTASWGHLEFTGVSMDAYAGDFECAFGVANSTSGDAYWLTSTVWEARDVTGSWNQAKNFTALVGRVTGAPQISYNRSDGRLLVGFSEYYNAGSNTNTSIVKLGPLGADGPAVDEWLLDTSTASYKRPNIYVAKDRVWDTFWLLDAEEATPGLRNATWKDGSWRSRSLDAFETESNVAFDLFGVAGPKAFTKSARSPSGIHIPGILDCQAPFSVLNHTGNATAYQKVGFAFDGKDASGNSRGGAGAFWFHLSVGTGPELTRGTPLFVDSEEPEINVLTSDEHVSPFASLGVNDQFIVDIVSTKPGLATLNVLSGSEVSGKPNITDGVDTYTAPALAADPDGVNKHLFFSVNTGTEGTLSYSRSSDGGLSWEVPKGLFTTTTIISKAVAYANGPDIYCWFKYGSRYSLVASADGGDTFSTFDVPVMVDAVTSDGSAWHGSFNSTHFLLNRSTNLGMTSGGWHQFLTIPHNASERFEHLDAAAHDPVSGNYSFVLTNNNNETATFAVSNHDGSAVTWWEGIGVGNNNGGFISNYEDYFDVDVRPKPGNPSVNEWVILGNHWNPLVLDNLSSWLVYSVTDGDGAFTPWENFTGATGELTPVFIWPRCWDVDFVGDAPPTYVELADFDLGTLKFQNVRVHARSSFAYGVTKSLDSSNHASITFVGLTAEGERLPDGQYQWELRVRDKVGNVASVRGNITLDNTPPQLNSTGNLTTPATAFPSDEVVVTVDVLEDNPDAALLYWRVTDQWVVAPMAMDESSAPLVHFTATIPAQPGYDVVYWKVVANDTAGNVLDVDNNGLTYSYERGVFQTLKVAEALAPTTYDDWTWSWVFTSGADHVARVWLRAIYDGDANNLVDVDVPASGSGLYEVDIAHDLAHQTVLYQLLFESDEGVVAQVAEKFVAKPTFRLEPSSSLPDVVDLQVTPAFNVTFAVPEHAAYVAWVEVRYSLDDGLGERTGNATLLPTGEYSFQFAGLGQATFLTFTVVAHDVYGGTFEWGQGATVALVPALPAWNVTPQSATMMALVSLLVGLLSGTVYSFMTRRGGGGSRALEALLVEAEGGKGVLWERDALKKEARVGAGHALAFAATGLTLGGCVAGAAYAQLALAWPEVAMLFATGAMLASTFLWVLVSDRSVNDALSRGVKGRAGPPLLVGALIYASLLALFFFGDQVAWWRARVNQQTFTLGSLQVPQVLTTVTSAFLSSIVLLTWSVNGDVARTVAELAQAEKENENPGRILVRREQAARRIAGGVGTKGILFVGVIGAVLVFASDLSAYSTQGLLVILPFVVGALVTLAVFGARGRERQAKPVLFDRVTTCPSCGATTGAGATYCEQCGAELVRGTRVVEGVRCEACGSLTPRGASRCRSCGLQLVTGKSEPLRKAGGGEDHENRGEDANQGASPGAP